MATNVFNRYIWLVDTIHRAERISFEEINQKWLRTDWSEGQNIPLRTFHNHRSKIEDLFDINIDCNGYNEYFIATGMDDGLRKWLLNTFTVNNLIHESYSLKDRILFGEIPSGQLFLTTIIEAMRDGVTLQFQYKPFWYSEIPEIEIKPYCVKILKQRWYVLGENKTLNKMRIYALDRIQSITVTHTKFKTPKDFKADAYFENAYGIVVHPEISACVVKLKVFDNCRNYIHTLPLHHSQEEVESNTEYSIFKYSIAPTKDFMQEILSYGDEIEVLSPESFRSEVTDKIKKMNKLYKKQ
jgi:hypothetical protein